MPRGLGETLMTVSGLLAVKYHQKSGMCAVPLAGRHRHPADGSMESESCRTGFRQRAAMPECG